MTYRVETYRDHDSGRSRWAVLHLATGVWYFPRRYGRDAARALARRLDRFTR